MGWTSFDTTKAWLVGNMKRRFESRRGTAARPPDLKFVSEVLRELLPAKQFEAIWKRVEDWDRRAQPCELADDIFTYLIVGEAKRFEHIKGIRDRSFAEYQREVASRGDDEAYRLAARLVTGLDELCLPGRGCTAPAEGAPAPGSGAIDVTNSPGWLVQQLESTAPGCEWLLRAWAQVRECLQESRLWWFNEGSFRVIRLLGKEPRDALEGTLVAEIFLASHAVDRCSRNPFSLLRGQASLDEVNDLLRRLGPRVKSSVDTSDKEQGRQTLLAIVEQAIARLQARAREHVERASGDEATIAVQRAFDASPRGQDVEECKRRVKERVKHTIATMRQLGGKK